jgi:WD40 repeat protein
LLFSLAGHTDWVRSVAWSPDGTKIATASDDNTARVWSSSSGSTLLTLTGHSDSVQSIAWSPDGTKIATSSDDRTARVWSVAVSRTLPPRVTNACSSNLHNCVPTAVCSVDSRKTFSCSCGAGYSGNDPTTACTPIVSGASLVSLHAFFLFLSAVIASLV